jgi:hypothetical protein
VERPAAPSRADLEDVVVGRQAQQPAEALVLLPLGLLEGHARRLHRAAEYIIDGSRKREKKSFERS